MKKFLQIKKFFLFLTSDFLTSVLFYLSILFFIIGFGFTDTPTPFGWYQQFMPNLNGMPVSDLFFLDSLTGWACTGTNSGPGHINYILKTTNSGDNWNIAFTDTSYFSRIKFINSNTGFASGGSGGGTGYMYRSINGGINWVRIGSPGTGENEDMAVLNQDTLWVVDHDGLVGGVYFTSNGGVNWVQQYGQTGANPSHIYMYNARIGFMDGGGLKKTTDGGFNWSPITGEGLFFDMFFVDSLTGWKCNQLMKKTTDGGLTWINQILPSGGNIILNYMLKFSHVNIDTLWGAGGVMLYGSSQDRGMIFKTTNGGNTWGFQIPDTSIHIPEYLHNKFVNQLNGWAYAISNGVHTVSGGDTITYLGIKHISSQVPDKFILVQNYPNPFNPKTIIKYSVKRETSNVKLIVYDIQGKQVTKLVDQKQIVGEYEVKFDGTNYSSGVYFYSLIVDGKLIDTKKALLMK